MDINYCENQSGQEKQEVENLQNWHLLSYQTQKHSDWKDHKEGQQSGGKVTPEFTPKICWILY